LKEAIDRLQYIGEFDPDQIDRSLVTMVAYKVKKLEGDVAKVKFLTSLLAHAEDTRLAHEMIMAVAAEAIERGEPVPEVLRKYVAESICRPSEKKRKGRKSEGDRNVTL
jgi:hypothetical protein